MIELLSDAGNKMGPATPMDDATGPGVSVAKVVSDADALK
jgi:hypothetical protein